MIALVSGFIRVFEGAKDQVVFLNEDKPPFEITSVF
jgi:hypothetical protein